MGHWIIDEVDDCSNLARWSESGDGSVSLTTSSHQGTHCLMFKSGAGDGDEHEIRKERGLRPRASTLIAEAWVRPGAAETNAFLMIGLVVQLDDIVHSASVRMLYDVGETKWLWQYWDSGGVWQDLLPPTTFTAWCWYPVTIKYGFPSGQFSAALSGSVVDGVMPRDESIAGTGAFALIFVVGNITGGEKVFYVDDVVLKYYIG